ncbi:MAG TPA: MarC family protein, partial [Candidatus Scatomorpha intestinipullorum]|nr:MarC family protein [Candidatus Scatomorpha intestinipullorum]
MFGELQSQLYSILLAAIAILAVLNPFGNLPQFIAMTEELETSLRQSLFRNILYTSFVIVIIFLLIGPFIMRYLFNVDLNDLRIAGGLLLILVSLKNLLFASHKAATHYETTDKSELLSQSIVPMAFPMLVGPGTLSTV